jgi:aminodeoxyfutalosine deaminase
MSETQKRLISAAWIASMDAPPRRDGAFVIQNGRILAIGDAGTMRQSHPDAEIQDFGDAIVLPGLINPHTHLELSCIKQDEFTGDSFVAWILSLPKRMGRPVRTSEQIVNLSIPIGVTQCLKFGVTTVGDISQNAEYTRPLLSKTPLRVVSYGEVLGLGAAVTRAADLFKTATDDSCATDRLMIGLTPHAPYTVDLPMYHKCLEYARSKSMPLATHLAETLDENNFLILHDGPFRDVWLNLGHWRDSVQTFRGKPIAFARSIGMLEYPTLLAHVNYCDDDELAALSHGQASVVYCPRTHAFFGHRPHRWREMLACEINVAVGTDSCASSPDLNIVDDLRMLHRIAPDAGAMMLWSMATTRAAKALQMESSVGSLTGGKRADFVVFKAGGNNPLNAILETDQLPMQVFIGGEKVN